MSAAFKLTYSTMFDPPPELHQKFEAAAARVRAAIGKEHGLLIGGRETRCASGFDKFSPIDARLLLGRFQNAAAADVDAAVDAARRAWPDWAARPWRERVEALRRAARLVEERVYEMSAALAMEVGKNRMEALGEVQETADLISWYCDQMEQHGGYDRVLPQDPLPGYVSRNRTVLKPYGVWAVIAPFNFPMALAGGPAGAALVTGNAVVIKAPSAAPWTLRLLADAMRDAGLPDGVFSYLSGSGAGAGEALVNHPGIAGITFTGSYDTGMSILRRYAAGRWPRPCIAEMGGKNAVIVSRHADLERAATGIVRSAFGLSGQKCSACSRVLVEAPVAAELAARLVAATRALKVGDPLLRENWMGPVISAASQRNYLRAVAELRRHGEILVGGEIPAGLDDGHFVAPTFARLPHDHALWSEELFLPLALVGEVRSLDEGIARANAADFGLTAGFYGAEAEIPQFLARIEAGVTYVNRPQGATTGAWPGYQPFGGWKGSGSTGKAIGSFYYLPQYLREQSQTIVD
jgi:acyl-CoA reductase-like NAD-dependent aldehyde dehydrogenase